VLMVVSAYLSVTSEKAISVTVNKELKDYSVR